MVEVWICIFVYLYICGIACAVELWSCEVVKLCSGGVV